MKAWHLPEPVTQVLVLPLGCGPDGQHLWERDEWRELLQLLKPKHKRTAKWKQASRVLRVLAMPCMYNEVQQTVFVWDTGSSSWRELGECERPVAREGTMVTMHGKPEDLYMSDFIWRDISETQAKRLAMGVDLSSLTQQGKFLVQDDKGQVISDVGLKLEVPATGPEITQFDTEVMSVALVPTVVQLPVDDPIPVIYLDDTDDDDGGGDDFDPPMLPLTDPDETVPDQAPGGFEPPDTHHTQERVVSILGLFD